jgi:hypothetical protein
MYGENTKRAQLSIIGKNIALIPLTFGSNESLYKNCETTMLSFGVF